MITAAEARGENVPYTEADVDRKLRMVVWGELAYNTNGRDALFYADRWTDELTALCEGHGFTVKFEDNHVEVSW